MKNILAAGRPLFLSSAIALMVVLAGCQELIITTGDGSISDTTAVDPGLPVITGDNTSVCEPSVFMKSAAQPHSSTTAMVVPNSYIVVLNDGVGAAAINELRGSPAIGKLAAPQAVFHSALNGFVDRMTAAEADRLRSDSRVKYVEQNYRVQLDPQNVTVQSTSAGQVIPWGITKVGGSRDGSGRTAWIIDTGIDLYNSDLNVDLSRSRNFVDDFQTSAMDGNGHGTHVAGIIGARDNSIGVVGVAANAQLVAVRVLNDTGAGDYSTIIEGIDYVTDIARSGDVINLSVGGPTSRALDDAVRRAAARGIKVVVAAGNESDDAIYSSPARVNYPGVYTVSAEDANDAMASFSNYGSVVDVAAPGVRILSTRLGGGTVYMSGTSMAAPHVAGLLLFGSLHGNGYVTGDPDGCDDAIAYK